MIHFFTDPYKDELIYSAISRYHYYTGNIDYKDTLEELFGKRSIVPSLEIGSNIDTLSKNLGDRYTAENIIKKHTIFPYYSPFLPKDRKAELIKEIAYRDGNGIYAKLGMVAGSVCKKNKIYYCPCCAKNEIEKYGEPYIHREHQLQGIYICPHDGVELKKYSVDKSNSSRIEFIRLDKKLLDLRNITVVDSRYYDKLYKISKNAYYLLQTDLDNISKEKVLEKYKSLLYEKGLTTSSKRVKQRELYEKFISFYSKNFLEEIESRINNDDEYNWLRVITRNLKRTVHPIRHLLLINFLEDDIEKFFKDINKQFNPFGKGPWPCLNSAADHYKQNVVTDLKITEDYKIKVPVGTFTCKCGFVYSRKGPDKTEQDKCKIGRIKNFGVVWENKLKVCLKKEKYGLRELARIMNCDPKTVIKFDKLFGINYFNSSSKIVGKGKKPINSAVGKIYKLNILKAIEMNTILSRTEIREICKKEYIYLYRMDKEWLFSILPQKVKKDDHRKKVDWDKRDREILELIKVKHKKLLNKEVPIRITKSSIGKAAGVLVTLEKNINNLPKTEKWLNEIIETVEEFQIRRCKKIVDYKLENGEDIKLWKIQRTAGIRKGIFRKVEVKLEKYIEENTFTHNI
ncbi:TnsD family transposase [Clostridium botulinum]|nr:TnsD family transposase [Clostridium botulinum]